MHADCGPFHAVPAVGTPHLLSDTHPEMRSGPALQGVSLTETEPVKSRSPASL